MMAVLFYIFAVVSVATAVMMITRVNPVASAMCLVVMLFALAALFVLLDATFLAVMQVLVYAGAVMVLFIFVIMLLNLKPEELEVYRAGTLKMGVSLVIGLMALLLLRPLMMSVSSFPEGLATDFGQVKGVGWLMFSKYLVPFEMTSILLLVAIVGAVFLAKKKL